MYGSAINGLAIRGNSDLDISANFPEDMNHKKVFYSIRTCLEKSNYDKKCDFSFNNF
jgi:hypothetical protein